MIMKAVIRELTMRGIYFLHTAANQAVSRKHSSECEGGLAARHNVTLLTHMLAYF